jgi:hypothetical protein
MLSRYHLICPLKRAALFRRTAYDNRSASPCNGGDSGVAYFYFSERLAGELPPRIPGRLSSFPACCAFPRGVLFLFMAFAFMIAYHSTKKKDMQASGKILHPKVSRETFEHNLKSK